MAVSIGTLFATLRLRDTFSTGLQQAGKNLEKWSRKQKRSFQNISDSGKRLTAGITLPVAGLAVAIGKISVDFETAFTGVLKTVGAATDEFGNMTAVGRELEAGLRRMATELPITATELAEVAENAGQLGIKAEDILEFTEVMAKMGVTSNLSATEASQALAKIANITKMSTKDFDRLGSTIVDLGNNFATNEAEVAEFGVRLAGAANIAGMSEADFLAIGAAVASVGVQAEAGGTAMSKTITKMHEAVLSGGQSLHVFAATAGMTSDEFKTAFADDAAMAFASFIQGLGVQGDQGLFTLKALKLDAMRTGMSLKNLAGAGDLMNRTLRTARGAWEENSALQKEAELRFKTTASQLKLLANNLTEAALVVGDELKPVFDDLMVIVKDDLVPAVREMVQAFADLTPEQQKNILKWMALVAVIGPALIVVGQAGLAITGLIGIFGKLTGALGMVVTAGTFLANTTAVLAVRLAWIGVVAKIAGVTFLGITAPVWGWIAAIVAAGVAIWAFRKKIMGWFGVVEDAAEETDNLTEKLKGLGEGAEGASEPLRKCKPAAEVAAEEIANLGDAAGETGVVPLPILTEAAKDAADAQDELAEAVQKAVDVIRGVPARAELAHTTKVWDRLTAAEKKSEFALKLIGPTLDDVVEALGPGALRGELFGAHVAFHNLNRESLPTFLRLMPSVQVRTESLAEALKKSTTAAGGFFGSIKTGFKGLMEGMTGGKGVGGLMSKLGGGVMQGLGGALSGVLTGGMSTAISMGVGLATKGIKKLGGFLGGLFGRKSKEQKEREAAEAEAAKKAVEAAAAAAALVVKMTAEATQGLTDLIAEGARTGQLLPEHLKPYLEALREAGKLTLEDKDLLLQMADEAAIDFDGMKSAADKYGIALSSLGPAFDIQRLHRAAQVLADDWKVLTDGGADVQAVIEGMGDEVQALIIDALKAGRKIPKNLQPIIEKMIEQGSLTDELGNKITDMSQLEFAAPITEKFDALLTKLDELIDRIAGPSNSVTAATEQLTTDLNNLPDPRVSIAFDYDIPDFDFGEGNFSLPGFQHGTNGFRDFGGGTPVMLHGREAIVPAGQSLPGDRAGIAQMDRRLASIERLLRDQPRTLGLVVSDSLAMVR